jgi:hypothetical protein
VDTYNLLFRVGSLSIILEDIKIILPQQELASEQEIGLQNITEGCNNVLNTLDKSLEKYQELNLDLNGGDPGGLGSKVRRGFKRLALEPDDMKELQVHIISNISLLDVFNGKLVGYLFICFADADRGLSHPGKHPQRRKNATTDCIKRQDNQERCQEHQAIIDWPTLIDYAPQ